MNPKFRIPKKTTATNTQKMLLLKSKLYCSKLKASTFNNCSRKKFTRSWLSSSELVISVKLSSLRFSKL